MSLFDDWNAGARNPRTTRQNARTPPLQPTASSASKNPFDADEDEASKPPVNSEVNSSNAQKPNSKQTTAMGPSKPSGNPFQDMDQDTGLSLSKATPPDATFLRRATSMGARSYSALSAGSGLEHYLDEHNEEDEDLIDEEDDPSTQPRFSLEAVDWRYGLGNDVSSLRSMTSGNGNSIFVVAAGSGTTEQVWLWLAQSHRKVQVQISSHDPRQNPVHKCFICPLGHHAVISLENGDNYYVSIASANTTTVKSRGPIQRLKDVVIDSIGWDRENQLRDSTGTILLGSSRGGIWEVSIEDALRGKEKKYIQKVYQLGMSIPVCGLETIRLRPSRGTVSWYVMAVTAPLTRFYEFSGGPTLESMFKLYEAPEHQSFRELPGEMAYSELRCFAESASARPSSFMLLSEGGLYIGRLEFTADSQSGEKVTSRHNMIYFPSRTKGTGEELAGPPLSAVETEFHYVLLYASWLIVVGKLNEEVVHEQKIDSARLGATLSLVWDPARLEIFLCSKLDIQRLLIQNEDGNVWKLFLDQARAGDPSKFDEALQKCKTDAQRDKVISLRADYYFSSQEYDLAAEDYAECRRSFEDVSLMFIDSNQRKSLRTYLLLKLAKLPTTQNTQRTIVCVWLVEIYLETITTLSDEATKGEDPSKQAEVDSLEDEFHSFMRDYVLTLRPTKDTIYKLIAGHGRDSDFLAYAKINGDYERVIVRHMLRGRYDLSVDTLAAQSQVWRSMDEDPPAAILNLFYKYSPELIEHQPSELVDTWIDSSFLDPCKLIPAIVRFTQSSAGKDPAEAVRYLEHCINVQGNQSEAIHNLLLSLYAARPDDGALRKFLQSPNRCFDLKYALRVCSEHNQTNAAVDIYSIMDLYAEAVELALKVDLDLAKFNAGMAQDAATRRKLWLMIAEHEIKAAVEQQSTSIDAEAPIQRALLLLSESDALTIEDVLQFLPDVVAIGELKDEICRTLEHYGQEIDSLKAEMAEFTDAAEAIRDEINAQNDTFMVVNPDYSCDLCGLPVLEKAFYVFPCTHAFHSTCLLNEVARHVGKDQQNKIDLLRSYLELQEEVQAGLNGDVTVTSTLDSVTATSVDPIDTGVSHGLPRGAPRDPTTLSKEDREKLSALDNFIAAACPFCGDLMIQSIAEPFISEDEEREAEAWAI